MSRFLIIDTKDMLKQEQFVQLSFIDQIQHLQDLILSDEESLAKFKELFTDGAEFALAFQDSDGKVSKSDLDNNWEQLSKRL